VEQIKNYQLKNLNGNISTYQNANVAADRVITLYTNGPAIESASLCTGASRD